MTAQERSAKSRLIIQTIESLPELAQARVVMAFASLPDEADLYDLWRRLVEEGKTLVFPVLVGDVGRMDAHIVKDISADLKPGRFGLPEPQNGVPLDPRSINFIFIPAVAYDSSGHRLGRGGGYYDRFLSGRAPGAFRCGVAFECQVLENVPVKAHDCAVDALVTENRLRRFPKGANCSSRDR